MSDAKKTRVLYLPSTPLNLLVSVAHATAYNNEQDAQLVLIDQKSLNKNPYFSALKEWGESPFEQVDILPGKAKGLHKLAERKVNFSKLVNIAQSFKPNVIAVGSDRRVEFQFLMQYCRHKIGQVSGWYMDDGLYSYAGRPYKRIKDNVNGVLKKLVYGLWWQEPPTIGASSWVEQAWLFSPIHAISALQQKKIALIKPEWFDQRQVANFSERVLLQFGLDQAVKESIQSVDLFLLIPHPNNIEKMTGYEKRIELFLTALSQLGLKVAIKYHPRSQGKDTLNLAERYGAYVLPNNLAFEFVLPLINRRAFIVGDVSTVLMTARWLRPDVTTLAVLAEHDEFAQRFKSIISSFEIPVLESFDDVYIRINSAHK
ncbi:MAG: hypothetical protein JXR42_02890 [Gammaproteobacteria bacterium]|nr:hypothetical protein [Gammaproteobacteria bacterium]